MVSFIKNKLTLTSEVKKDRSRTLVREGLKIVEDWKKAQKQANFTPENCAYMILCGVGTYFSWEKGVGWNILRPKRRAPLKVFVMGPLTLFLLGVFNNCSFKINRELKFAEMQK